MIDTSRSWIRTALGFAVTYAVIGVATVAASRAAGGAGMQTAVRIIRAMSWLLSAVLYLLHLIIENRSRPRATVAAWHTSAAVAMATLLLALVATARQLDAGNGRPAVFVAIAAWPILTGLVSWVVGVVLSGVLGAASRPTKG